MYRVWLRWVARPEFARAECLSCQSQPSLFRAKESPLKNWIYITSRWMFVIRMYYARGYIYGVNGIFTQPNISNKGQNSELGWWLYLKWNNHEMLVSWFHDMRWWYHGIMTWPCWFQNWLHQRTHISSNCCTCFGSTYTKIGTIQRRLAWPLRKDDTQNREAFHIFCTASS